MTDEAEVGSSGGAPASSERGQHALAPGNLHPRGTTASYSRRRFLMGIGALVLGAGVHRAAGSGACSSHGSVLIIGDSMALCGFGERLDARFRDSGARCVNTFMACGTQPLSWTKIGPYAKARTHCGLWRIESNPNGGPPVSFQDTYGMTRGHRPSAHEVPKIEDLIAEKRPDILVVQLGNNLFDLLKGKKTSWKGAELNPYIAPFLARAVPVRRTYWVAPPTCGRIPGEAQDVLVERLRENGGDGVRVIDSRTLITYPYRGLQADKQHFFGNDMKEWADRVFAFISEDIASAPLGTAAVGAPAVAEVVPVAVEPKVALRAECSLESMSEPFTNTEIAPYNESLVAFVYRIRHVLSGSFRGSHVVVLRPAHIAGKRQPMNGFFLNQARTLNLIPLEETPWATLKAKDDVRFIEIERFITDEDHRKLRSQS